MREVFGGLPWFDFAGHEPFKREAGPGILASRGLRKPLLAVLAAIVDVFRGSVCPVGLQSAEDQP